MIYRCLLACVLILRSVSAAEVGDLVTGRFPFADIEAYYQMYDTEPSREGARPLPICSPCQSAAMHHHMDSTWVPSDGSSS